MRFLVDTNVLISAALFPGGKAALVFSHIVESHTVVLASYALEECQMVFERKFPDKKGALAAFLGELEYEFFETPTNLNPDNFPPIRDGKDLPILASAILADANILLTGDKDFLDLPLKKPLIFTPAEYFDLIKR